MEQYAGEEFAASLIQAPTGMVGTLRVSIVKPDATVVVDPTTDGIVEQNPGWYVATLVAPTEPGPYIIVWDDNTGETFAPEDLTVVSFNTAMIPTVEDVAKLLMARTKDKYGNELGTFTGETKPTDADAASLIKDATDEVLASTDSDIPAEALPYVRQAIATRAAMLIERAYYPEQINSNRSPFNILREDYERLMGTDDDPGVISKAIERETEEQLFGELPATGKMPSWGFPSSDGGLDINSDYHRQATSSGGIAVPAEVDTASAALQSEIDAVEADVVGLHTQVDDMGDVVSTLQSDVATVEDTTATLQTQVNGVVTDVANKAPLVHTHPESDVVGLVADLAGKSAVGHIHPESDVTNLVADLASKAAAVHTHAESDITNLVADLAGKQPVDSDLTAIAALSTTSFGRALLTLADAAALRAAASLGDIATHNVSEFDASGAAAAAQAASQPVDSDLTAIAALSTTAFGRALLTLADAAALRSTAGLVIGTDVQAFDSDLASIAALATTAFGRSVLTQADAAALRTLAGLVIGTDVQAFDSDLSSIAALATTAFGRARLTDADAVAARAALSAEALPTLGTHSARLAAAHVIGRYWRESDTGLVYYDDGTNWNIWKGEGVVPKTASETVNNSAALQNDDHLFFPIEPNELWFVEALLLIQGASTNADWLFGWTGPTGATADWAPYGRVNDGTGFGFVGQAVAVNPSGAPRSISQSIAISGGALKQWQHLAGTFQADASHAGNIQFQWAQNTATAENNIIQPGSHLRIRRLA